MSSKVGLFLILIIASSLAEDFELNGEEKEEDCSTFEVIEDENGTIAQYTFDGTVVKFFLLTPSNDTIRLNSTNVNLVNTSQPTKIMVHGLGSFETHTWIDRMARVYHTKGNYNIIAVDWSVVSQTEDDYIASVVDSVGRVIGTFLIEITSRNMNFLTNVHLIGSSLGAQVSGAAGEAVSKNGKKVERITGLDPLNPQDLEILDEDDAEFVDVIHTSVEIDRKKTGTVDFYILDENNGQPICYKISKNVTVETGNITNSNDTDNGTCGELLATQYYISTIDDKTIYQGISCYNADVYVQRLCDKANSAVMGEHVPRNASGKYVVSQDAGSGMVAPRNYFVGFTLGVILWYLVD